MSIETTLTLLIAGGILLASVAIRLVVMGLLRLGFWIAGREMPRLGQRVDREGRLEDALPRTQLRARLEWIAQGAGAVAIFIAATIGHWLTLMYRGLRFTFLYLFSQGSAATSRTYRRVQPRVAAGSRRVQGGSVAVAKWTRKSAVPYLVEARTLAADGFVTDPERAGDLELFGRNSPVIIDHEQPEVIVLDDDEDTVFIPTASIPPRYVRSARD